MAFAMKEQVGIVGLALLNGIFIYPFIKKSYRRFYSVKAVPTHYAYFDIEIDGRDAGRLNFELFGNEAPKTVNNFLAFASGEYSRYFKYRDSKIHEVVPGKFIKGGDLTMQDGTGSASVYDSETFESEKNKLKFIEPYLLAASSKDGKAGSQFFITLDQLPPLNGSDHTIFGRLISGTDTISQIEGVDDLRKYVNMSKTGKEQEIEKSKIYIKNSGVYKFEQRVSEQRNRSAAGVYDFNPADFYDKRNKK